ncbi:MAG: response regulator [Gammaproteobacteria bacterium]|nr:response regulator [Gammaproteobacteria bacterium]
MPDINSSREKPLILVVDDDAAQLIMLEVTLNQAGMTVAKAANGSEAVASFKKLHPDLILMDILMPVMNGLQACAAIRELKDGKGYTDRFNNRSGRSCFYSAGLRCRCNGLHHQTGQLANTGSPCALLTQGQ